MSDAQNTQNKDTTPADTRTKKELLALLQLTENKLLVLEGESVRNLEKHTSRMANYKKEITILGNENRTQTNRLNTYLAIIDNMMAKDETINKQANYIGEVRLQVNAMEQKITELKGESKNGD